MSVEAQDQAQAERTDGEIWRPTEEERLAFEKFRAEHPEANALWVILISRADALRANPLLWREIGLKTMGQIAERIEEP